MRAPPVPNCVAASGGFIIAALVGIPLFKRQVGDWGQIGLHGELIRLDPLECKPSCTKNSSCSPAAAIVCVPTSYPVWRFQPCGLVCPMQVERDMEELEKAEVIPELQTGEVRAPSLCWAVPGS